MRKPKNALMSTKEDGVDLGVLNMTPVINFSDLEKEFENEWDAKNKIILRCS